jgi:hypothetical protein
MFAVRRGLKRLDHYGRFQPEIEEARSGDFHLLTQIIDVEFRQHIGGKLARIYFSRLGERHERVALVIAEFRVGTGPNQNNGRVSIRYDCTDSGLELQFNLFVRQHLFVELLKS